VRNILDWQQPEVIIPQLVANLVKNSLNKKRYLGMGRVTGKGGVTAYVIAFA